MSGSKLPSYILPMFPALALVLGFELTRLSRAHAHVDRVAARDRRPCCCSSPTLSAGTTSSPQLCERADAARRSIRAFGPWVVAALAVYSPGGIAAFLLFRNGRRGRQDVGRRRVVARHARRHAGRVPGPRRVRDSCAPRTRSCADAERANGGPLDPRYPGVPDRQLRPDAAVLPRSPDAARRVSRRDERSASRRSRTRVSTWPTGTSRGSTRPQAYALMTRDDRGRSRATAGAAARAGPRTAARVHRAADAQRTTST